MENTSNYRLKTRRTKIVATVGPASNTRDMLTKLIQAGVDVVRLNFSHGTHQDHGKVIELIRSISEETNTPVAILGDLCGPKIRAGYFEGDSIQLVEGEEIEITTEDVKGCPGLIPTIYQSLVNDVSAGEPILLDDGKLELKAGEKSSDTRLKCQVIRGGKLSNRKGINLPGTDLSTPALTAKDIQDLEFCVAQRLDFIALSFVRQASEIADLRQRIINLETDGSEGHIAIIAKIEKPEAMENIDSIMLETDGIMVARGDLGVELPAEKVPIMQNQLIRLANHHNKPVIIATQVLESMIECQRPTRAEVSDAANAVLGNADAVMLSAESAAGRFPLESVQVLDSVLREAENYQWSQGHFGRETEEVSRVPLFNALAQACSLLSRKVGIRTVNVYTNRGNTARLISSSRPNAPVLAYTRSPRVARQLRLYWGLIPVVVDSQIDEQSLREFIIQTCRNKDLAQSGHYVLNVTCPTTGQADRDASSIVIFQVP